MTDEEYDDLCFKVFNFAERVISEAHDLRIPAREGERLWNLVRDIADGKVTLVSSPADLLHPFPKANPRVGEMMRENVGRLIAQDRELARRIFSAFQRLVRDIPPGG